MFELFEGIILEEENHTYRFKEHAFKYSVTGFIEKFCQKFDQEYWSKFVAKRDNIPQEEVLRQWSERASLSSEKGNQFHLFMECTLNDYIQKKSSTIEYDNEVLKNHGMSFFEDVIQSKRITPLYLEKTIFDLDLDIAGTVDFFGINHQNEYIILDWKTNREIKRNNKFAKMLPPFEEFDDSNFYHYSLQLNIYRYIIEKHCKINVPYLYFIWFNESEERYKLYPCVDMREQLDVIFK